VSIKYMLVYYKEIEEKFRQRSLNEMSPEQTYVVLRKVVLSDSNPYATTVGILVFTVFYRLWLLRHTLFIIRVITSTIYSLKTSSLTCHKESAKMQEMKMKDQITRRENAIPEIAGPEKCRTKNARFVKVGVDPP